MYRQSNIRVSSAVLHQFKRLQRFGDRPDLPL
jgi:hypothetical protein